MFQELLDNLTNVGVFTSSVQEWVSTLSINKVIIFIMMIFMIVGAIDKIRGNKLGYGDILLSTALRHALAIFFNPFS